MSLAYLINFMDAKELIRETNCPCVGGNDTCYVKFRKKNKEEVDLYVKPSELALFDYFKSLRKKLSKSEFEKMVKLCDELAYDHYRAGDISANFDNDSW